MADIACVDHEVRLRGRGFDTVYRFLQRPKYIRIGRLVEADMAIGNLHEGESARRGLRLGFAKKAERFWHTPLYRPKHACAHPHHTFEHATAVYAAILVVKHVLSSLKPC